MPSNRHPLLISYTACVAKRLYDYEHTDNAGRRRLFRHYIATLFSHRAKLYRQLRELPRLRMMGLAPKEIYHG